jgi:hypothetical protein
MVIALIAQYVIKQGGKNAKELHGMVCQTHYIVYVGLKQNKIMITSSPPKKKKSNSWNHFYRRGKMTHTFIQSIAHMIASAPLYWLSLLMFAVVMIGLLFALGEKKYKKND